MVGNVNETVSFYRDILGFEVVMSMPTSGVMVWAFMKRGGVSLMFQERHSLTDEFPRYKDQPVGATVTFYIDVADVHTLFEHIKGNVIIAAEMHTTPYGSTEFAIEDINGYVLVFAQHK